jgi:hypothetical protein
MPFPQNRAGRGLRKNGLKKAKWQRFEEFSGGVRPENGIKLRKTLTDGK